LPLLFFGGVDITGNWRLTFIFGVALVFVEALAFELAEDLVEALLKDDFLLIELAFF